MFTLTIPLLWLAVAPGLGSVAPHAACEPCSLSRTVLSRLSESIGPLEEPERRRLDRITSRWAELFDFLPLEHLQRATLRPTELELHFDFGRRAHHVERIPDATLLALSSDGTQLEEVVVPGCTVRICERVRVELAGARIRGIHKGDLEVRAGFFYVDLSVRTKRTEPRVVTDERGRAVAELDPAGRPVLREGGYKPRTSDTWLVLEAWSRKTELALYPCVADARGPARRR